MIDHDISGKKMENFVHEVLTSHGYKVQREFLIKNRKFTQKMHERRIDIRASKSGSFFVFLEVDGKKPHGDLENPTNSTLKRNADFERINLSYILINDDTITTLRKLLQEQDKLKNITKADLVEFLVLYMMEQEFSKALAKIEAGGY